MAPHIMRRLGISQCLGGSDLAQRTLDSMRCQAAEGDSSVNSAPLFQIRLE